MVKSRPEALTMQSSLQNKEPEPQVTPASSPGLTSQSTPISTSTLDPNILSVAAKVVRPADISIGNHDVSMRDVSSRDASINSIPPTTTRRSPSSSSTVSTCSTQSVMPVDDSVGTRSNGSLRFESMSSVGTTTSNTSSSSSSSDHDAEDDEEEEEEEEDYNTMLERLQSSSYTAAVPQRKPSALPSPARAKYSYDGGGDIRGKKRSLSDSSNSSSNSSSSPIQKKTRNSPNHSDSNSNRNSPIRKKVATSTRKSPTKSKLFRVKPRAPTKHKSLKNKKEGSTAKTDKPRPARMLRGGTSIRDPQAFQQLASRNGGCFMKRGSHGKLIWRCARGHLFKRDLKSVRDGKWCWPCARVRDVEWRSQAAVINAEIKEQWRVSAESEQEALFDDAKKRMVLAIEEKSKHGGNNGSIGTSCNGYSGDGDGDPNGSIDYSDGNGYIGCRNNGHIGHSGSANGAFNGSIRGGDGAAAAQSGSGWWTRQGNSTGNDISGSGASSNGCRFGCSCGGIGIGSPVGIGVRRDSTTAAERLGRSWTRQSNSSDAGVGVRAQVPRVFSQATAMNPFECLGLSRGADTQLVKRRFKQLALKYHPDKNAEPGATDAFCAVSLAYKQILREGQVNTAVVDSMANAGYHL